MNMYIWYRNIYLYEGLVHAVIAKYWSFNFWRISSVVLGQIFPLKIFGEHGGLLGKPESSDAICLKILNVLQHMRICNQKLIDYRYKNKMTYYIVKP